MGNVGKRTEHQEQDQKIKFGKVEKLNHLRTCVSEQGGNEEVKEKLKKGSGV